MRVVLGAGFLVGPTVLTAWVGLAAKVAVGVSVGDATASALCAKDSDAAGTEILAKVVA